MKAAKAAVAALIGVGVLSACSPTDWHRYVIGPKNPAGLSQGYHVDAAAGGNDGGGSRFAATVVCSGENFWRVGNWISVDTTPNWPNNRFRSEVWCPYGRGVIATNTLRAG